MIECFIDSAHSVTTSYAHYLLQLINALPSSLLCHGVSGHLCEIILILLVLVDTIIIKL